ncbi:7334_t:CDS:2 [Funneliformis caledonium]|uniref:7334_t:CDS:1 n=1 Tax=Funneliformis caledonium TaxID=1117310 RepID=A0A9N9G8Z1_9GLOM|nr:7334_t:CDS:2 [Funneliformis caledonium]
MRLAIDVTNGLQCIHSHGIVHTSLHPHNVLVHNGRMVIGDLGLSKTMDASIPENIEILPYIEPNVLANPSYPRDKRSDIYSLGLLMYEISSERAPFSSFRHNFEVAKKILSGSRDKPILGTPIEYIDLYEQCWDNDPMARPTVDGVLSILGRMNLTPVYDEDFEMTTFNGNYLKGVERKDVKVKFENSISIEVHPNEANNVVATSSKNLNSVSKKSGGGVDSGFGEADGRRIANKEGKEMQIISMSPKM